MHEQIYLAQLNTSKEMLSTHDWMEGLNTLKLEEEVVEVRFKNNRKDFFRNSKRLRLQKDDRVIVDVEGGHDVGIISLTSDLANKRFARNDPRNKPSSLRTIYRKATPVDIEGWLEARKMDRPSMLKCREIANALELHINISDVEFRGDRKKMTVYYTSDERVDFRELLKKYMETFRVKIELRQIGARQTNLH